MSRVTNSGSTPEAYFVDARLDQTTQLNLSSLTTSQMTVPIDSTNLPLYMVPTHTTSVTASAKAPAPIYFDYWWVFGDPDLISSGSSAQRQPQRDVQRQPGGGRVVGDHALPGRARRGQRRDAGDGPDGTVGRPPRPSTRR